MSRRTKTWNRRISFATRALVTGGQQTGSVRGEDVLAVEDRCPLGVDLFAGPQDIGAEARLLARGFRDRVVLDAAFKADVLHEEEVPDLVADFRGQLEEEALRLRVGCFEVEGVGIFADLDDHCCWIEIVFGWHFNERMLL